MQSIQLSFYTKASLFILGIFAFTAMLYFGQSILVPLIYSFIFAILLRPPVSWLIKKKVNRVLAISIILTLSTLLLILLGIFLFLQASHFGESFPAIINKLQQLLSQAAEWWSGYFKIKPEKISEWVESAKSDLLHNSSSFIGSTLTITGKVIAMIILIPVYVFMILYYKPLLVEFLYRVAGDNNTGQVKDILGSIKNVVQKYLSGLLIEAAIVAALTSFGLIILGMDYAVLLGIISALLNLIPYLGIFIAMVICAVLALVTKDSGLDAFYVLIMFGIVQAIDNNFLVPKIVGGRVKVNALFTIIAVIAGGLLWGIPGMFLAIPITAILKVISDRVETIRPLGYLLGVTMPENK